MEETGIMEDLIKAAQSSVKPFEIELDDADWSNYNLTQIKVHEETVREGFFKTTPHCRHRTIFIDPDKFKKAQVVYDKKSECILVLWAEDKTGLQIPRDFDILDLAIRQKNEHTQYNEPFQEHLREKNLLQEFRREQEVPELISDFLKHPRILRSESQEGVWSVEQSVASFEEAETFLDYLLLCKDRLQSVWKFGESYEVGRDESSDHLTFFTPTASPFGERTLRNFTLKKSKIPEALLEKLPLINETPKKTILEYIRENREDLKLDLLEYIQEGLDAEAARLAKSASKIQALIQEQRFITSL